MQRVRVRGAVPCALVARSMDDVVPLSAAPCGLEAVLRAKGFQSLMPIQAAVLAPETEGRDLRISSQTGSGKTVAVGLAVATLVAQASTKGRKKHGGGGKGAPAATPAAVFIAPTRELAAQLGRELGWLFEPLGASVVVVTGGTSIMGERRELAQRPEVIVGTPGRLRDHLEKKAIQLERMGALVLDEADEMLDMGFEEDIDAIMALAPEEHQTHLVSATFTGYALRLANRVQSNPLGVEGSPLGEANEDIAHRCILLSRSDRLDAIVNLLLYAPDDKTLIFVRTRIDTLQLATKLAELGFSALPLSGEMTQRERNTAFRKFQSGTIQVLVATDVAARGLDVQDIARVIHADLPDNGEVLTHRSGRTGRAGRSGRSIMLVGLRERRKAERMLRDAGVRAKFIGCPGPEEIRAAADARLLDGVKEAVTGAVGSSDDSGDPEMSRSRRQELAARLLEETGSSPEAVIGALLELLDHAGPTEPRTLAKRSEGRSSNAKDTRGGKGARGRDNDRRDAGGKSEPRRGKGAGGDFVAFQVSWGATRGADARRLLALVCRRGNVTKDDVGAIRVGPRSSSVEIARSAVATFEAGIRRPDTRDGHVRFRRWKAVARPS